MTRGMVSSSNLPDRPSRRARCGGGAWMVGWSSFADTNIRLDDPVTARCQTLNRPHCRWSHADLRGCVPHPDRSNYRSLMSAGSNGRTKHLLAPKNPAKTDIFAAIAPFQRSPIAAPRVIDENRGLPDKPRNCPRWPGSARGRLIWGRKRPVLG